LVWLCRVESNLKTNGNETSGSQSKSTDSVDNETSSSILGSSRSGRSRSRRSRAGRGGGSRSGFGTVCSVTVIHGSSCAVRVGCQGAVGGDTYGLRVIHRSTWNQCNGRCTSLAEQTSQCGSNGSSIGSADTETGGRETNFLNEVCFFGSVNVHESVNIRHSETSLVVLEN